MQNAMNDSSKFASKMIKKRGLLAGLHRVTIKVVELNNNNNIIYHEDCKDFMKRLSSHGISVDVVVTSPPYNNSQIELFNISGIPSYPMLPF